MTIRIYVDTSAFLRGLLNDSSDHQAMLSLLADPGCVLVSSELLWLEADRTAIRLASQRSLPGFREAVTTALGFIDMIPLDRGIINAARAIPQVVKSLSAIHIASAELLGTMLDHVVTYDQTMTSVLRERGLPAGTAAEAIERHDW